MLTAKVSDEDVVNGIKGGADDYIRKPFSVRELVVRIYGLLRRLSNDEPLTDLSQLGDGDVVIDFAKMRTMKKKR